MGFARVGIIGEKLWITRVVAKINLSFEKEPHEDKLDGVRDWPSFKNSSSAKSKVLNEASQTGFRGNTLISAIILGLFGCFSCSERPIHRGWQWLHICSE